MTASAFYPMIQNGADQYINISEKYDEKGKSRQIRKNWVQSASGRKLPEVVVGVFVGKDADLFNCHFSEKIVDEFRV